MNALEYFKAFKIEEIASQYQEQAHQIVVSNGSTDNGNLTGWRNLSGLVPKGAPDSFNKNEKLASR